MGLLHSKHLGVNVSVDLVYRLLSACPSQLSFLSEGKALPVHQDVHHGLCSLAGNGAITICVQDEERLVKEAAQAEVTEQQLQQALAALKQCQQDLAVATAATASAAQREDSAAQQSEKLNSQLAAQQEQSEAALQALQQQHENLNQQAQHAEAQRLQEAEEAGKKHAAELWEQGMSQKRSEEEGTRLQVQLHSAAEQLGTAQQAVSKLEDELAAAQQQQTAGLNELQQAQRDLIAAKAELDLAKQQLQAGAARKQEAVTQRAKMMDLEKVLMVKLNELHALQQNLLEKGVQLQVRHASLQSSGSRLKSPSSPAYYIQTKLLRLFGI